MANKILDFLFGSKVLKDVAGSGQPKAKSKSTPAYDMDQVRKNNEESAKKQKAVQEALKKRKVTKGY